MSPQRQGLDDVIATAKDAGSHQKLEEVRNELFYFLELSKGAWSY